MSKVTCTVHEWGDRGTPGNYWRECWLCGAIEDVDNRPDELDDGTENEYRGYEVTVFIPDAAPKEVCEAIFDAVADACNREEEVNPMLRDRKGWDLAIEGSPADHRTEAAFSRVVDECSLRIDERNEARATIERVKVLAAWFQAQPNWNGWGIHRDILAALESHADPA